MAGNLKTTGTGLKNSVKGVDILNAVRNSLPAEYSSRLPEATKDSIKEYGASLKRFPVIMNAFVDVLVNKIGLTVIKNKSYTNPLKMFQRGDLEVGDVIEEIFVDVVKAKTYAEEIKAMFKETSSLSNSGINELFQEIAEKILASGNYKENNKKKGKNSPDMTNDDGSDNSDKTGTTHLKTFKTNKDKSRCC